MEHKYFIYANGKLVSIFSNKDNKHHIKFLHYDNLGSIDTITNYEGVVEERFVYKPFGERINLDEDGNISSNLNSTNRGFTGHEHIEEFEFIHMNGRVYDPTIGRFLSADPHIQDSKDTQSYNRYTYVKNNPLKYTDPSGFFFKKLFKKIKKWIKPVLAIASAIYTGGLALAYMGYASIAAAVSAGAWGAVMGAAAIGGFVSGAIMTGSLKGALTSAAFAAISAGVAYGIGHGGGELLSSLRNAGNGIGKYIMHGISRAAITKAQGGRWSSGFWSGFITSGSGSFRDIVTKGNYYANIAFSSIIGGTASEISGGKFANGAVTGAFVYMFNDALEGNSNEKKNIIDLNIEETKKISGYEWMKKVEPGGEWDYKSKIGLEKGEDLGNFNYGATGAAKGFTLGTLLSAAGIVQVYTGTARLSFYKTFFDDPQDQIMIKHGYDYYMYKNYKNYKNYKD